MGLITNFSTKSSISCTLFVTSQARLVSMTKKRSLLVVMVSAFVLLGGSVFQNCAKAKWIDPDTKHSAFAMGFCQSCGDESGQGVTCRTNLAASFANCNYESCNSGFQLVDNRCEPVVCEKGAFANCEIPHGQGRKQCNNSGNGYGSCHALECDSGYEIKGNACEL